MRNQSDVQDCLEKIRSQVAGDLRTDAYSRMFYSTDASIYQVNPLAVVIPRNREDIHAVIESANEFQVPVLARGAGSSLAGQAVGEAIVIDFTRHLDTILEVNPDARTVKVEPGVVLGLLNTRLAPYGLQFGPDPASADRAAIGGIVSNNSTGAHSIVYGMTADHVIEMNVVLSDGSRVRLSPLSEDEAKRKTTLQSSEGRLYRDLLNLVQNPANESIIREDTPRHWRRCGGYNLDRMIGEGPSFRVPQDSRFNLAKLVCGGEGTLAVIEDVTLNLVPIPSTTGLAIVHFEDLHSALESIPLILESEPSAIELLDRLGMSLCRTVPAWRTKLESFVAGEPECVLITEYSGENVAEVASKIDRLEEQLAGPSSGAGEVVRVLESEGQRDVWSVRKMGLGFLMSLKGDYKPIPFIEDAAVPPQHLAKYVTGIEEFCQNLGTKIAYYAHASAGCVHIRPLINTKDAKEISKLPEITSFAIELLHGFGGALSSEHGDGRARSAFNERFFGEKLYGLYRSVKSVFDPGNLLNPGNIVDAKPMTENLRFGPDYSVAPMVSYLDFSEDQGFDRAVEMCNGSGVCRKIGSGTMCPSFMATREEEHSTRGRANALRAILTGEIETDGLADKRLYQTMDLCLECKACASECPSSVDMTKLKMEFLAHYQSSHGVSRRSKLFANIARTNRRFSGRGAGVANAILGFYPFRWALERSVGISSRRSFPPFAREPFTEWFKSRSKIKASGGRVVLFNDTFNTFNYPNVAISATKFLEASGFEVILPGHGCCGRPMLSKGLIDHAREAALETVEKLYPLVEQGFPVIGLEPSCLLTFRDEYASLLPNDDRIDQIANASFMFDEFVATEASEGRLSVRFRDEAKQILFHGHCHQKSMIGTTESLAALSLPDGFTVHEIDSGCCGMAGSFGFELEHYDLSMKVGEDRLFPAVRNAPAESIICVSGVSCRQQIEHGTGRRPKHLAEVLWEAVKLE
ncbi:MAG: FAD-binding protein [Bacteroidetes bacterium]|nr:FAD-binding protein [Bacteroidota bacterium]